jgi:transcriptional antiterminator Rof (Rho-off)
MTDRSYDPIDCGLHSLYEQFIMQRTRLRARWHHGQDIREVAGCRAIDLYTRAGEEFIRLCLPNQDVVEVRLDRIIELVTDSQPG